MKFQFLLFISWLTPFILSGQTETIVENFDNNDRKWFTGESGTKKASISDGMYKLVNLDTSSANHYLCDLKINPHEDYTIEAKMRQISGEEEYGYGILYGFDDWSNYVRFYVSEDYFKVLTKRRKKSTKVVDWKKDTYGNIKGKNNWNTVKIVKNSKGVKLYINKVEMASFDNLLYVGGDFGFFVPKSVELEVDWVKVTRVHKKMKFAKNATLSGLENLGANVNSKYTEKSPNISADGKTLYYTVSENPDRNIGDKLKSDIAYSKLQDDGTWGPSVIMDAPLNNEYHNYLISISPDENSGLFGNVYNADGTMNGGISYGIKRNGQWQRPQKVKVKNYVNDNEYSDYWLSPDGLKLISACENKNSLGEKDIMVSFKNSDGSWSEPQNMGHNINTWMDEFTPYIAADGITMFYSSYGLDGYGSADVFMTKRLDDTWTNWSDPINCGPVINSEYWDAYFRIDAQGIYGYMVSTGDNSLGEEDLFRVKIGEGVRPELLNLVIGKVYNAKTNEIIEAAIEYEDLTNGKKLGIAYSTVENGYKIILPKGKKYGFLASAEGYIAVSNNIDLTELKEYGEREINLYLVPIESGQTLTLNNLFFDSRMAIIKKESYSELNRLVEIMKGNPDLNIEIGGHTDNVGQEDYNMDLSNRRANSVLKYLIGRGVDKERVKAKGYGEAKPIEKNDTPEGRQKNRRVELRIL